MRTDSGRRIMGAAAATAALVLAATLIILLLVNPDRPSDVAADPTASASPSPTITAVHDEWRSTTPPPETIEAARNPAIVWTGEGFLVWGGSPRPTGGFYNPRTDRWTSIADAPLSPRENAVAVWTGSEMIVWGGIDIDRDCSRSGSEPPACPGDGAAYDPKLDRWRTIAASPLAGDPWTPTGAWTGSHLVIWSSADDPRIAAYDPTADRWEELPEWPLSERTRPHVFWSGSEIVFWGGGVFGGDAVPPHDGAAYDPVAGSWRTIEEPPIPARVGPRTVAWTGDEMIVWGGLDRDDAERRARVDGAAYDPRTHRWRTIADAPVARAITTGTGFRDGLMIVVPPGQSQRPVRAYVYDPSGDQWTRLDDPPSWDEESSLGTGGPYALLWSRSPSVYGPPAN